jgi:glycosyltransferase involved in cell wall biosynthesis
VVVPTRNSGKTLGACLQSIRSQTYEPIELVVVDNQSTDQSLEIAAQYASVVVAHGPERSAQRNRGAELSSGRFLLFVDSDMRLESDVVKDCVGAIGLTEAGAVIIPEVTEGKGFLAHCRQLERSCYFGDDAVEAARFFSRDVFEMSGGFDESLTGPEDWDLTTRIRAGRNLPRTASLILHDEDGLALVTLLLKKRYYAASFLRYWRKHGRSSVAHSNPIFRSAFLRSWRRLVRHPILTAGIFFIKTMEAGAAAWGILEFSLDRKERPV